MQLLMATILQKSIQELGYYNAGYKPIRVMFYYPNRDQAIRIQLALEALYHEIGGDYYYGNSAWEYIGGMTGIDLKRILEDIAKERMCAE